MKPRANLAIAVFVGLLMLVFPLHAKARDHDGDDDDARPAHHHHDHDRGRNFDNDSDRGAWHHNHGQHRGWYKHHHHDAEDEDDGDNYSDNDNRGGYVAPSNYGRRYRRGEDMADYPYLCDENRDQCGRNPDFRGTVPALPTALQPLPQPAPSLLTNQSLLSTRNRLVAQERQARNRYNQAIKNHNRKAAVYWLTRIKKLDAQIAGLNGTVPQLPVSSLVNSTSTTGSAVNTLAPVVQQMMTH